MKVEAKFNKSLFCLLKSTLFDSDFNFPDALRRSCIDNCPVAIAEALLSFIISLKRYADIKPNIKPKHDSKNDAWGFRV
jgi:hypothetical protein